MLALCASGVLGIAALLTAPGTAQQDSAFDSPEATRAAMQRAEAEAKRAQQRGAQLEAEAAKATAEAEKTAQQAAALAARIQQAEAGIAAAEARLSLIAERAQQARPAIGRAARAVGPPYRGTAELCPPPLGPLGPEARFSARNRVSERASRIRPFRRSANGPRLSRSSIARGEALAREADQAIASLREQEETLGVRQRELAAIESRQRIVSRQASGAAARETERALALSEEARDLSGLVRELSTAAELREELAALPGPVLRPSSGGAAPAGVSSAPTATPSARSRLAPVDLQLPVAGRTVTGFGSMTRSGVRSQGLTIVPRGGAQVIAPAAGRVAFAGPYRGFGRIVILEHGGGWTSLVTGLARSDVDVGEELVAGAPLGVAGVEDPEVTLELRRGADGGQSARFHRLIVSKRAIGWPAAGRWPKSSSSVHA